MTTNVFGIPDGDYWIAKDVEAAAAERDRRVAQYKADAVERRERLDAALLKMYHTADTVAQDVLKLHSPVNPGWLSPVCEGCDHDG